jgi:hypothetical protein
VKDEALVLYCERIEREFFRHKGRPGTLSPGDFARAEAWYRAGVPVEAAIAAVEKAFESHARGRERDVEEVNGLAYCESFFEKELNRRRGGRTRGLAR